MKKILYVHHVSSIGGGSYCLLNILKELDRSKYTPIVLLKNNGPLISELNKLGVECYFLPTLTTVPYNKTLFSIKTLLVFFKIWISFFKFGKLIKKINVDIVHLNNLLLYPYLKLIKKHELNTIVHVREHWPLNENVLQLKWAQNFVFKYADKIVAINKYSASMFPRCGKKIFIVYDWIDFSDRYECMPFKNIFEEDMTNLKVYLYTGGIQKIKGVYEIISSFSKYLNDTENRLLLVGINPTINKIGVKSRIKFILSKIGFDFYEYKVKHAIEKDPRIKCIPATYSVKHLYEQSYCYLSYFSVPHANLALAESIVLKTVPIAAKTPESLEYSNNGELAVLFNINDSNDFIDKIKNINNYHSVIKQRLEDCSSFIADKFDRERNVKILNKIYIDL